MTSSLTNNILHVLLLTVGVSKVSGETFDLDMTNRTHNCPGSWVEWNVQGKRLCARPKSTTGCVSATFIPQSPYTVITGEVKAYQYGAPDGFISYDRNLEQVYLDGISFTRGPAGNRQHVFSLAAGQRSAESSASNCPCARRPGYYSIPEVGWDFYCESGHTGGPEFRYFFDDPLFDGQGCTNLDQHCCDMSSNTGEFVRHLPKSNQPIEMRICADETFENEEILVEHIKLSLS